MNKKKVKKNLKDKKKRKSQKNNLRKIRKRKSRKKDNRKSKKKKKRKRNLKKLKNKNLYKKNKRQRSRIKMMMNGLLLKIIRRKNDPYIDLYILIFLRNFIYIYNQTLDISCTRWFTQYSSGF